MYIPEFNRVRDHAEIVSFVHANPFAILVSPSDTGPFASHIPILAREVEDQMILHGHLAKANPHWELLQKNEDRSNDQESLVIFHGPHAYISPSWYVMQHTVPTWNYAAVHVYGVPQLLDTVDLRQIVYDTTAKYESAMPQPWNSRSC